MNRTAEHDFEKSPNDFNSPEEKTYAWHVDKDTYVYACLFALLGIVGIVGNVRNITKNCCQHRKNGTPAIVADTIFFMGKIMSLFNISLFVVRTFTTVTIFVHPLAFGRLVCLVHFISNFHVVFGLHFTSFFIAKETYNAVAKKNAYLEKPKRVQILAQAVVMWAFLSLIVCSGFMMRIREPCSIPSELSFAFSSYSISISIGGLILSFLAYIKIKQTKLLSMSPTIAHIAFQGIKISLMYFVCWSPLFIVVIYNKFCETFGYHKMAFMNRLYTPPRILLNCITLATLVSSATYPFVCKLEILRTKLDRKREISLQCIDTR